MNIDAETARAKATILKIRKQLVGIGTTVQGAVLADLLATWVAAHPPELRETVLTMHLGMVRKLVPVNAREIAEKFSLSGWVPS